MKALTVREPWGTLIASGKKTIETRTRLTHHRGDLLICGAKPLGMSLCIVEVYDCRPMEPGDWEAACCDPYPNAWGWRLRNVRLVERFAVKGQLGLYNVADELIHIQAAAIA